MGTQRPNWGRNQSKATREIIVGDQNLAVRDQPQVVLLRPRCVFGPRAKGDGEMSMRARLLKRQIAKKIVEKKRSPDSARLCTHHDGAGVQARLRFFRWWHQPQDKKMRNDTSPSLPFMAVMAAVRRGLELPGSSSGSISHWARSIWLNLLTWGVLQHYPVAFLVTDLRQRRFGTSNGPPRGLCGLQSSRWRFRCGWPRHPHRGCVPLCFPAAQLSMSRSSTGCAIATWWLPPLASTIIARDSTR